MIRIKTGNIEYSCDTPIEAVELCELLRQQEASATVAEVRKPTTKKKGVFKVKHHYLGPARRLAKSSGMGIREICENWENGMQYCKHCGWTEKPLSGHHVCKKGKG